MAIPVSYPNQELPIPLRSLLPKIKIKNNNIRLKKFLQEPFWNEWYLKQISPKYALMEFICNYMYTFVKQRLDQFKSLHLISFHHVHLFLMIVWVQLNKS